MRGKALDARAASGRERWVEHGVFWCLPDAEPVSGFSCARRPCPLSQAPPARPRKPSAMFFQTPSLRAPSRFFRHHGPIAPRTRISEQRSAPPRRLEPAVDVLTTHDAHVVTLRAPSEDVELREPMAYEWHQRDGTIVLEGLLTSRPLGGAHVYRCRRQVPLYQRPSPYPHPVEILPPGSCLRGSAPSSSGWIGLESDYDDDEPLYCRDDGGLVLLQKPSMPQPQRFVRHVNLPADAALDRASCSKMRGGQAYQVTIPRHRPLSSPPPGPTKPRNQADRSPKTGNNKENSHQTPRTRPTTTTRETAGGSRDALHSAMEPILQECCASPENVSTPTETVQHWLAAPNGGFVKAAAAA